MKRKLPPYADLYRLIVDKNTPLRQVAAKYGVTKESVYRTFKRDAQKAGITWPIERDLGPVLKAGVDASMIDSKVIADLVREAYWESEAQSLRQFGDQTGIGEPYLSDLFNGKHPRISKPMALRLLAAIGEEPHPTLAAWKPYYPARNQDQRESA